jgi:hypothetical protein
MRALVILTRHLTCVSEIIRSGMLWATMELKALRAFRQLFLKPVGPGTGYLGGLRGQEGDQKDLRGALWASWVSSGAFGAGSLGALWGMWRRVAA